MRILTLMLLLGCAGTSAALGQSAPPPDPLHDWRRVVMLPPGTSISIRTGRHWHHCAFDSADEAYVECSLDPAPRLLVLPGMPAREMAYRREDVKKVRLEDPAASSAAGAVIGAGTGAAVGAIAKGDATRSGSAMEGALVFGIIGGVIGRCAPFVHGKVIYEQPAATGNTPEGADISRGTGDSY